MSRGLIAITHFEKLMVVNLVVVTVFLEIEEFDYLLKNTALKLYV